MDNNVMYFQVSSEKLQQVLKAHSIPRNTRMKAMKDSLREYVAKTRYECLTLDSRKNYRLLWFKIFSEFQLNLLFQDFNNKDLAKEYVDLLFKNILEYLDKEDTETKNKLEELLLENQKKQGKEIVEDIEEYNNTLDIFFYDEEDHIDGHLMSDFRPIIFNSATQKEIVALGEKYDIKIPETLNGDSLREYVKGKLEVKNLLDKYPDIDSLKVTEVREIAKKENIYVAISLNKQESIEYILQRYAQTKTNYEIPLNKSVYQMNIPIDQNEDKYQQVYIEFLKQQDEVKALRESLEGKTQDEQNKINDLINEKELLMTKQNEELEDLKERLKNNTDEYQDKIDKLKEELENERRISSNIMLEKEQERNKYLLILKGLKDNEISDLDSINKKELEDKLVSLEEEDIKLQEEIKTLKEDEDNKEDIDNKEFIRDTNIQDILTIKEILMILNQLHGNKNEMAAVEKVEEPKEKSANVFYMAFIAIVMAIIIYIILHFTIR